VRIPLKWCIIPFFYNAPLSWAARNSSKPGRSTSEIWVLHATHDWTSDNEGADPRNIAERLLEIFFQWTAMSPVHPRAVKTRLWPFASASPPLDEGCLWSGKEGIGICGDWCAMSRVEGAFLSGTAVAERILGSAAQLGQKVMRKNRG